MHKLMRLGPTRSLTLTQRISGGVPWVVHSHQAGELLAHSVVRVRSTNTVVVSRLIGGCMQIYQVGAGGLMISLLGLASCGAPGSVDACEAGFSVTFADGTTAAIDGCSGTTMEASFEFDPDDPPEFRTYSLRFDGTPEDGFDCSVT